MSIRILDRAEDDLVAGYWFYEQQEPGVGAYFLDTLYSDIESLVLYAGIHPLSHGDYHRMLSKRFPYAIYYRVSDSDIFVHAVLDCRRDPVWTQYRLDT